MRTPPRPIRGLMSIRPLSISNDLQKTPRSKIGRPSQTKQMEPGTKNETLNFVVFFQLRGLALSGRAGWDRGSLKRDEHGARVILLHEVEELPRRSANARARRVTDSIFKWLHCLRTQLHNLAADFARVLP